MFMGRAALAFVTTTLIARNLGTVGRGEIVYITNLSGLLSLVASAGTIAAINKLHPEEMSDHRPSRLGPPAALVGVGFGVVAALVYVAVAWTQGSVGVVGWAATATIAGATIVLLIISNLTQVASLDNRIGAVTWAWLVGVGTYAAFTLVTVVGGTATVTNNAVVWALTSIIPLALLIWPTRAVRLRVDDWRATRATTRRLASLSLRANLAATAVLAIWRLDVLIVSARRGYRELGLYSIAVALAEVVLVAAMAIRSALLPHHRLGTSELGPVVARVTRTALAVTTVLAIGVAIVGRPTLSIVFGPDYVEAYPALLLLLPGTIFLVLHYPIFDYIAARGGSAGLRSLTIMGAIAVIINTAGNVVLLTWFDYTVAAITSTATYAFVFGWCCRRFHEDSGVPYGDLFILKASDLRARTVSDSH